MESIKEKIVNTILNIFLFLFGILLVISLYNTVQVKVLKNDYSSFFGYSLFEVQTGSMKNAINVGDWILVKYDDDVKIKDIVTFKQNNAYITHRVIEQYNDTYVTKGDANNAKDKPIKKNQIVGTVKKILPHFGIIRKTLFDPIVLIFLFITVYVISVVCKKDSNSKLDKFINKLFKKNDKIEVPKLKNDKKNDKKNDNNKKQLDKWDKEDTIKEIVTNSNKNAENNVEIENDNDIKIEKTKVNYDEIKEDNIDSKVVNNDYDDMEKTVFFRAISVDKSDLESSMNIPHEEEEEEEIIEETITSDDELEEEIEKVGKKRNKKFTNILEKVMFFKYDEISNIIEVFNDDVRNNEATIKKNLINSYIDARYYNFCGNINTAFNKKNMLSRIDDALKNVVNNMIESYNGNDSKYALKVKKYYQLVVVSMYLEKVFNNETDNNIIRDMYEKTITKYYKLLKKDDVNINNVVTSVLNIQRKYRSMNDCLLKKLDTNLFILDVKELSSKKDFYGVSLSHNIKFSNVYSNYIVDKTYTEGVIEEDKIIILLTMLSKNIISDMFTCDFKNKYLFTLPSSIYGKENKLLKIKKLLSDEYIKNNVYILLNYKTLSKNVKVIKKMRSEGFKFGLVIDEVIKSSTRSTSYISLVDYVFVDKKNFLVKGIIPDALNDNVINEDVLSKIEDFGGED